MLDHLINFFIQYGNFAVFGALILCGFGLPIPEDVVLVAGGVLSGMVCEANPTFLQSLKMCHEVHGMFGVAMAGVLIGDSCMYLAGRFFGTKLLEQRWTKRILPQKRVNWVQKKFERYGFYFVFAARFMPGLRSPIFIVAGMTRRVSYLKFLITDGLAALISVPVWVYLGFWGERQLSDTKVLEVYVKKGQMGLLIILSVVIVTTVVIMYVKKKLKNKIKFLNDEDDDGK